ncbi:MAG TPA: ATP-binding protein [Gemmatimonadaceae bacterium]|nr:ATP-binding protein [Gemmatimonadaceae bacterium]
MTAPEHAPAHGPPRADPREWARGAWIGWLAAFVAVTLLMLGVRPRLDKAHVALVYLLVVLGASAHRGRAIGFVVSGLAFAAFNFLFIPPYYTLAVADPLDWIALLAFLVTSAVATQLLSRAQGARERMIREGDRAEALRAADRMKDALLASVSHDLRTPLTTITALAHDIAAGGDERALVITEEADRLTRFVTDLLDFSRLSGGDVRVTPELAAADDVAGALIQRLSGMPGSERLRVALDTTHPLLVGRFDFVHTLRIVVNLVENALKYAPRDTPVDVGITREGEQLVFTVADRGPGVPEAERERIFAPFYRPPGTSPDVTGAGLGLSIARRLAEAQAGSLTVEPRPGGGSAFVLRLPAVDLGEGGVEIPP